MTLNSSAIEKVLLQGDLSQLSEGDRVTYYSRVCEALGLNPLTRPFDYIVLNEKLTLYAKRECTEQLRRIHNVSVRITSRDIVADSVYVVTAQATLPDGRCDESIGAVPLTREGGTWETSKSGKRYFKGDGTQHPLIGEAFSNSIMKAETKAKRRVTLSICGLGLLDESETESIAGAATLPQLAQSEEPWKNWKTPEDAIAWAASQLPDLPLDVIRSEFKQLNAVNGKKALAWTERVKHLADSF